ncbi:MAG: sensor histidine kinase [Methylococcaceae bacterium]|nr:histidine kinase [Prolixibacteraceae bacterium]
MQMFWYASINSVLVGGTFMVAMAIMVYQLDKKLPWLQNPLKRLIIQFFTTIVVSLLIIVITILLTAVFLHQQLTSSFFFESGFFMLKIAFTFIFLGSLISNSILFFKNWKEAAVQQEKLKREQLALQYETLKSQVNPHFLFNNLNALTSLISTNPDKAIDFVKQLSEVYRYVLDQKDTELVDLDTELKFVESYVFLQKIRFGSNLDVQTDIKNKNFKVIPLSIQMLVENAIKHNEISDRNPLQIKIYSDENQYLTIENKLQKKSGSEGSGTGIDNIKSRYQFFTDRELQLAISKEYFKIRIPLLND